MRSPFPTRRWMIAAFAAVVAAWAGSANTANAMCGDHVQILTSDSQADGRRDTPAPQPCNGPHCQQTPAKPPVPTPPPTVTPRAGDALLTDFALVDPLGRTWIRIERISQPLRNPTSIFHPPRA